MKVEVVKELLPEGVELPNDVIVKISEVSESELKDAYKEETNRTLTAVDAQLTALSGLEKESGEKTVDFAARAFKQINVKITEQSKKEVSDLKEQLKEAEENGVKPEDLQKLQEALVSKTKEVEEKEKEYNSKLTQLEREGLVTQIKSGITFDSSLDEELTRPYLEEADRLAREVKSVTINDKVYASLDGVTPVVENDKNILLNDYIESRYSKLAIKPTPQGNGSDSDAGQGGDSVLSVGESKNRGEAMDKFYKETENMNSEERRAKLEEFKQSESYQALSY